MTAPSFPRYRCEEFPNLTIRVRLDDRLHRAQFREQVYDVAGDPELSAAERPAVAAALAGEVRRGKVPLYEDDGLTTFRCGLCDFASSSQRSVDAHRRAKHNG